MRLGPGRFLGVPVQTRWAGGFVFTEYRYPAHAVIRRHCHELAYFSRVLRGSYLEHCSRTHARECDAANVLYHPAGETHSDVFGDRGGAIFCVELTPRWTSALRDYEMRAEESLALPYRSVSWLMSRAYQAFADAEHRSALRLEATAIELLCQLPWKGSPRVVSDTPRWLKDVVDIVHAEFRESFSLTAIARRVGAHPAHVARAFRRRHRMTVGQYVRTLRVEYAMHALMGRDALSDIAVRAGFADQSHMGRVFRVATGMTPRQFRLSRSKPATAF